MKWMVERDDRRRLGQAVALHDQEAELAPEPLEFRLERRGAADDAPELPAEEPVRGPVAPPAPQEMAAGQHVGLGGDRQDALKVLTQDVEYLRHTNEDRDAARLDLVQNLRRTVAVGKDDRAGEHGRHERRHRLPE